MSLLRTESLTGDPQTNPDADVGGPGAPVIATERVRLSVTVAGVDDLSGVTEAKWSLYDPETDTTELTKTVAGGGITVPSSSGDPLTIQIDPTDILSLPGNYRHELLVIDDGSGNATVLFRGEFDISEEITPAAT
jgi:hypothetical protein